MKKQKPNYPVFCHRVLKGILMLMFGLTTSILCAQDPWASNFIDTIIKYQPDESKIQVDTINPQFNVTLGIRAFVVNSSDGYSHFDPVSLVDGLMWVNKYFKQIGLQFRYVSFDTIPEYEYVNILSMVGTKEMEVKYASSDYINLFIVDSILVQTPPIKGYASYPGDTEHSAIFVTKEHAGDKTLTQLMGNFFGLLNTNENSRGAEHANEDNCMSSGDYLCDTWADPNIFNMVDKNCRYSGGPTDANGDFYVPSVANLMSNAPDDCKCIFTIGQYRRMLFYYQKFRSGLK